jgi:predicted Zn-dependent protease
MSELTAKIAADVLAMCKGDQAEAIVTSSNSALTRFANNTIHQNVAEENLSVTLRVVVGKRVGIASGNDVSKSGLRRLAKTAFGIASHQQELPDFPGLPGPKPVASVEAYSDDTARLSPARRASMAAGIFRPAAAKGATASGTVSNDSSSLTVANSLGVAATARRTEFEASAVIEKGSGAGYAAATAVDHRSVDVKRVGRVALSKCLKSQDPVPVEPAEFTVVLEPQAVAGLLSYMAYMGFGAQSFIEGRSFVTGRLGEKLLHESVSIWDDGLDPAGLPAPFDFEGQPKTRVPLVDRGFARAVVYDTYFASKAGVEPTGHALPPGFSLGPLPTNLFMAPGTSSTDEMISSTDRGLLVTRFHYINIADPSKAVLTGLTRDGTFLIEKGRVTRPVRNLRFTESMLSAFSAVEALSAERSLEPEFLGAMLVPAAKLSRFRFTGATEF